MVETPLKPAARLLVKLPQKRHRRISFMVDGVRVTTPKEYRRQAARGTPFPLVELGPVPPPPVQREPNRRLWANAKTETRPAELVRLNRIIAAILVTMRQQGVWRHAAEKHLAKTRPYLGDAQSLHRVFQLWATEAERQAADADAAVWQRRWARITKLLPWAPLNDWSLADVCCLVAVEEGLTGRALLHQLVRPAAHVTPAMRSVLRGYYPHIGAG